MNTVPAFQESPPLVDAITSYDLQHKITYLRLLDAQDDGADWREAVKVILGIDVASDPDFAKRVHDNHLARAEWMTKIGWRYLLEGRYTH